MKSFNFGKSIWQVLQRVPYMRAEAGIAWLALGNRRGSINTKIPMLDCCYLRYGRTAIDVFLIYFC